MVSRVREIPFTSLNNCIILCIYMCSCAIFYINLDLQMRLESCFVIIFAHQQKKCTMTTTQNDHIHLITSLRGGVYTLGLPKILALQHSPTQASGIYAEQHQWRSHHVLLGERERAHVVLQLDRADCMYLCVYFMYVSDGLCAKHSSFLNVYVNLFNNLLFFYKYFMRYLCRAASVEISPCLIGRAGTGPRSVTTGPR